MQACGEAQVECIPEQRAPAEAVPSIGAPQLQHRILFVISKSKLTLSIIAKGHLRRHHDRLLLQSCHGDGGIQIHRHGGFRNTKTFGLSVNALL